MATIKEAFADYRKQYPGRDPLDKKDAMHFVEWLKDRVAKSKEPIKSENTEDDV